MTRFELVTFGLTSRRSNLIKLHPQNNPGGTRTPNLADRSRLLYPIELRSRLVNTASPHGVPWRLAAIITPHSRSRNRFGRFFLYLTIMGIASLLGCHTRNPRSPHLVTLLAKSLDLTGLNISVDITGQTLAQTVTNRINHRITIKLVRHNINSKSKLLHLIFSKIVIVTKSF